MKRVIRASEFSDSYLWPDVDDIETEYSEISMCIPYVKVKTDENGNILDESIAMATDFGDPEDDDIYDNDADILVTDNESVRNAFAEFLFDQNLEPNSTYNVDGDFDIKYSYPINIRTGRAASDSADVYDYDFSDMMFKKVGKKNEDHSYQS